jgi:hypothetical protein
LERFVRGSEEEKRRVIGEVRRSVGAIKGLDPGRMGEVIRAYAAALRVTFAVGIVSAVIVVGLTVRVKLPRLQRQDEKEEEEVVVEDEGRRGKGFMRRAGYDGNVERDDEETALGENDSVEDEGAEDYESYDGDVDRERMERLERQTSHLQALQLGRRASLDTTL